MNETGKSWYGGSPNQHTFERDWCASKLKTCMAVVDCGADHGTLALIFANAVGRSGKVYAYEVFRSNAIVVVQNAEFNGLKPITVWQVGIGKRA